MPPVSAPETVVQNYHMEKGAEGPLVAVLHTCTNWDCPGATIGYYMGGGRDPWRLVYHRPRYNTLMVPNTVPERPRTMLQDANDSRTAPVACTGAAVGAIDAMMAEMDYKKGSLLGRIEKAVADRVLPKVMGDWAKRVKEIGITTHTDDDPGPLPGKGDTEELLMFANMLAEYFFVLPARIPKPPKPRKRKPSGKTAYIH
jgi:hypothetical protein